VRQWCPGSRRIRVPLGLAPSEQRTATRSAVGRRTYLVRTVRFHELIRPNHVFESGLPWSTSRAEERKLSDARFAAPVRCSAKTLLGAGSGEPPPRYGPEPIGPELARVAFQIDLIATYCRPLAPRRPPRPGPFFEAITCEPFGSVRKPAGKVPEGKVKPPESGPNICLIRKSSFGGIERPPACGREHRPG